MLILLKTYELGGILISMIQKKLSKILFFTGFAKVAEALICFSHATEILDETNSKNPILAHNTQIPINSLEGTIDYITALAGTSITELPLQISQARQSKGLSPHIPLNQRDEFLNYLWYINDDMLVESPMSGQIISIACQKGQKVRYGQDLCIIEAMKMQNVIRSPIDGEVVNILVKFDGQTEIQPILKLRPLGWKSVIFQNILDNQNILSTLFPWEPSTANVLLTEDLITVSPEEIEKQTKPSQPVSIAHMTITESTIVTIDQSDKSSLPLHSVEESLTPILPGITAKEILATILLKNNNDIFSHNRNVHVQPILLPLKTQSQKKLNFDFLVKEITSFSVTGKQIVLLMPVYVLQNISTKSTTVTIDQPFKTSSLINKAKGHLFQSMNITAKNLYNDAPITFLSREQNKVNFKSFTNVHKKLYLLIVLYFFAFACERFKAQFRRKTVTLKTIHPTKFIPIFHKQPYNQNFPYSKHIKLA